MEVREAAEPLAVAGAREVAEFWEAAPLQKAAPWAEEVKLQALGEGQGRA